MKNKIKGLSGVIGDLSKMPKDIAKEFEKDLKRDIEYNRRKYGI